MSRPVGNEDCRGQKGEPIETRQSPFSSSATRPEQKKHALIVTGAIALILTAYTAIAVDYVLTIPMLVPPDEAFHYAYVRHLIDERQFPVTSIEKLPGAARSPDELEAHQPPLFYLTVAAVNLITVGHAGDAVRPNPHFLGTPIGNLSTFVPISRFPTLTGPYGPFYQGRLVSLAYGAAAVLFAFLAIRELFGAETALVGSALMAFNPQFLFIAGSFSNDAAGVAGATMALWLTFRAARTGLSPRRGFVGGLAVGLAGLAKLGGLGVLGVLGLVAIMEGWRHRTFRPLLSFGLSLTGLLVTYGWWAWRNLHLYGDPFGLNAMQAVMGQSQNLSIDRLRLILGFAWKGYWLDFSGGGILFAPSLIYDVLGILVGVSVICCIVAAIRLPALRGGLVLVVAWFALVMGGYLHLVMSTGSIMGGGRLLFPASVSVSAVLAVGLGTVVLGRLAHVVRALAIGSLAIWSIVAPGWYLLPLSPSPVVTPAAPGLEPVARFGDAISLVGWQVKQESDGSLVITCQWEARKPIARDYSIFVHHYLMSADGTRRMISQLDTYPGYGSFPTREWQPGQLIVDSLRLPAYRGIIPPGDFTLITLGLYDHATGTRLTIQPTGKARVLPDQSLILSGMRQGRTGPVLDTPSSSSGSVLDFSPPKHLNARFGGSIDLLGYSLDQAEAHGGRALRIRLYWRDVRPVSTSYTVFVHLIDTNGKIIAQRDNPPRGGSFPTYLWRAGDLIADEYHLLVPEDTRAGRYSIQVGLYVPTTGQRLDATVGRNGVPRSAITLAPVFLGAARSQPSR